MKPKEPSQAESSSGRVDDDQATIDTGDRILGTVPDAQPVAETADAVILSPPRAAGELGWLAHFRVLKLLGQGGMGMVYLAEDSQLKRPVALKVIRPDKANAAAHKRFIREAQTCAAVGATDHIVTIYHVGEERGIPYLAMQYLQGTPLNQWWLKNGRRLPLKEVLRIGREVATGLAVAHAHGLIHRDIKPANLWLEAPNGRVKILDFGLARPIEETDADAITHMGQLIGTPGYMAPEQVDGLALDARSDLFSLGCVLYELATGQPPYKGKGALALLRALATQTPAPVHRLNPNMPESVSRLIASLMEVDPAARPQTADAVVKQIETIEADLQASTAKLTPVTGSGPVDDASLFGDMTDEEETVSSVRRAPAAAASGSKLWIIASVGVVLASALALILYFNRGKTSATTQTETSKSPVTPDPNLPKTKGLPNDRPMDERERDAMSKLSIEEQERRVIDDLVRFNPSFNPKRGGTLKSQTFGGMGIRSVEIRAESLANLSSLRALPELDQIAITASNQAVNLKGLAGLPLTYLECKNAKVDMTALGEMPKLRHLDLSGTTIDGVEKIPVMYLSVLILNQTSFPHLDWLQSQPTIQRLELRGMPISTLNSLRGLKKLEILDITDCNKIEEIDALADLPLRELRCTFKPAFARLLKEHKTLTTINEKTRAEFFKE